MKNLTAEWIAKADEDMSVASGLIRRRRTPANTICFHSQQAVEKYLKAALQEQAVPFGKTHDLEELLRLLANSAPTLSLLADDCKLVTDYAVRYRYPGIDATGEQARAAVQAARRIRAAVLGILI